MILLAALFAALAVFVGVYTLVSPGKYRAVGTRLDRFERAPGQDREATLAAPFVSRVGVPIAKRFRSTAAKLLPASVVSSIEHWLVVAGEPISLFAFLTFQAAMVGAAGTLVVVALSTGAEGKTLLAVVIGALVLALMPLYWLRIRVASRRNALLRALPDAVDLIVTSVEAGLAIDAALAEVGRETEGPLGEELRLAVRETTLGRSRRDALQRLIDRTQVAEIKTFIQSIIQAEQTGIPIGQVLRTQAAQVRLRKRQRAEADAQRAPVKMVVILVLLVLPAMIMLVIGPALMQMDAL